MKGHLYPNAATGLLNINNSGHVTIDRINVQDMMGKVILSSDKNTASVHVIALSVGSYLLQIISAGKPCIYKFVKE